MPFHDFTWQFSPAVPISSELTTGLEIFDNQHQLSGRYNCFPSPCAVAKFSSFTLKKKPKVQLCPNSISPLMYSATSPGISWAGPRCSAVASVAGSWDSDLRLVSYRREKKPKKKHQRDSHVEAVYVPSFSHSGSCLTFCPGQQNRRDRRLSLCQKFWCGLTGTSRSACVLILVDRHRREICFSTQVCCTLWVSQAVDLVRALWLPTLD